MDEIAGTPPASPNPPTASTPASTSPAATPTATQTPVAPNASVAPGQPATAPAAPAQEPRSRRISRFDKLWEPVRRFWSPKDPGAVVPAGTVTRTKHRQPRVLFVCTGNAARSPMAEAFAIANGLYAESAGTFPAKEIPREAIEAMQEKGYDLADVRPKLLDPSRLGAFDRVVTFGASLPPQLLEGARVEDWEVWDPAGLPLEGYRLVASELEKRVARLAKVLKGKQAAKQVA